MAPVGVEDPPDYESDPDELNRSLATRRREASDDEDHHDRLNKNDHDKLRADLHSAAVVDDDEEDDDTYDHDDDGHVGTEEDSAPALVDGEHHKKKEPFAVPTAGAFYMHDNRFQEIDAASNRLTTFYYHSMEEHYVDSSSYQIDWNFPSSCSSNRLEQLLWLC